MEVGWLTTRLRNKEAVHIVVPNALLATTSFKNFGHEGQVFRTEIAVTLDHALRAARVERILLAAVRAVPEVANMGPGPDLKIGEFDKHGVTWQVRFWLDDFDRLADIRFAVQRSILQHLHQAGISLPYDKVDLFHAPMPERFLDYAAHRDLVLARSNLFRGLEREELERLANCAVERRLAAGGLVVEEGDASRALYVVLEGGLEAFIRDENGRERVVNRLAPGGMFGEFALLTGEPRSASVRAVSDVILLEIDEKTMGEVLQRCPDLAEELSHVLAERQADLKLVGATPVERETGKKNAEARLLSRIRGLFGLAA